LFGDVLFLDVLSRRHFVSRRFVLYVCHRFIGTNSIEKLSIPHKACKHEMKNSDWLDAPRSLWNWPTTVLRNQATAPPMPTDFTPNFELYSGRNPDLDLIALL
jgi:hypothetical protein